jgi:hypothetical protein
MSTIIQKIKEQTESKKVDTSTAFGRSWLLQKMEKLNPSYHDRMEIIRDRDQQRNRAMIGRMYFFSYLPKLREVLPYWDRFPLVIPLMVYNDGFLGLNLHYIYPKDRLILLQQLSRLVSGPQSDERTRLRLSYPILKAMHQAYRATPCIKRYLKAHFRSRFIEIPPAEWDIAAALPVQKFTSTTNVVQNVEVWKESREKY